MLYTKSTMNIFIPRPKKIINTYYLFIFDRLMKLN